MKNMKFYLLSFLVMLTFATKATTYYVDGSTTSSTQNGSLANPWKTLSQVSNSQTSFQPGDFILFKRGGSYTGTFYPTRGGTAAAPLTYGAYGSGTKPKFTGTGSQIGYLFYVNTSSYITFRDLWITDPTIDNTDRSIDAKIQRAFTFDQGATNCKIISCDITLVGVAGYFIGGNNTMDSCDVGNLRMVVDTDQGYQPGNDDDYGANPLVISSANNTITHNYFHDCWATSFDYTYDGGAIEFYGSGTNNNFIGYNTIYDCIGLTEITGASANNVYAYNKLINNGSLFYFQSGHTYSGYNVYNNVIIENAAPRIAESRMIGGSLGSNAVVLKNNIFHLSNGVDVAGSSNGITHEDNIYKLSNSSLIGFTPGSSELNTAVDLFANTTPVSALSWNYTPVSGSPAIDFGQSVGLTRDFAGNNVPAVPNSGILETGGTTPPANPLSATSAGTTISCNGSTSTVTVSATGGTAPYDGTGTFTKTAGSYSFTVTDAAGGSATTSIVIVEPSLLSAAVIAGMAPSSTGTATATVSAGGGTPTYTYSMDGGSYQSSNVFQSVTVGSHTVTVRDARACAITKSFTVSAAGSTPLVITAVTGSITCNSGTTTVSIRATGGRSPYTGTGTFTVGAGTYTYTVTDANGTTGTYSVTITQPTAIVATSTATVITAPGGVSVVNVSATGGTAPYTYRIGNGIYQSASTFSGITAGTYSITIEDSRGCTAVTSLTITVTQQQVFEINLSSKTDNTCRWVWDGTITVGATGGTAPYFFRINNYGYGSSFTFINLGPGTYTLYAIDATGLVSSISVIIKASNVLCSGKQAGKGTEQISSVSPSAIKGLVIEAYPNPTHTEFSMVAKSDLLDEEVRIVILNMNGQKLFEVKTRANQKIYFGNNFVSGMYIAKVTQGTITETVKLIKAK